MRINKYGANRAPRNCGCFLFQLKINSDFIDIDKLDSNPLEHTELSSLNKTE